MKDVEKRKPLYSVDEIIKWRFLKKLKIELLYNLAISLLGIYPKNMKTLIGREICTPHVHFSIIYNSQICEQRKCPSIDKWHREKIWDIYIYLYTPIHIHTQWNITQP